ncbi:MAG TPA: ATP phosphoribosyltransferase [Bacillota bacterium]
MTEPWLTLALPKGRLAGETSELLREAGLLPGDGRTPERQLVVADERRRVRYVWLRPADALTYVDRGVAAAGIVGKDVLLEAEAAVDELADLGIGRCRVALAAPAEAALAETGVRGSTQRLGRPLRIATHLPRVTRRYFEALGEPVELIYLRGSVEIAPLLGLADAIVDLVQTGATLRANGLVEVAQLLDVSCRLIAHPHARRGGDPRLDEVTAAILRAAHKRLAQGERQEGVRV